VPARDAADIAPTASLMARVRHQRQFYQDHGGENRDDQADRRLPWRDRAAVFTECPGKPEQRQHAECRL
jgi:hypothetical protein